MSWVIAQIAQRNICIRQVIARLLAPIIVLTTWVIAQVPRKHWVIAQAAVELLPELHPICFIPAGLLPTLPKRGVALANWVIVQVPRKHWVIAQAAVESLPKLHPILFYCSWAIAQAALWIVANAIFYLERSYKQTGYCLTAGSARYPEPKLLRIILMLDPCPSHSPKEQS